MKVDPEEDKRLREIRDQYVGLVEVREDTLMEHLALMSDLVS